MFDQDLLDIFFDNNKHVFIDAPHGEIITEIKIKIHADCFAYVHMIWTANPDSDTPCVFDFSIPLSDIEINMREKLVKDYGDK